MSALIPPELLSLIINELRDDKPTLSRLCQTSSAICHLVVPIIYEKVCITTNHSIMYFCLAINSDASRLGSYVRDLKLMQPPHSWSMLILTEVETHNFGAALRKMPNLQQLHLDITFVEFNESFNNLKPPFSLRRLCISAQGSETFKSFLCNQPSITELDLQDSQHWEEGSVSHFLASRPDVLPNLDSVTGSLLMLCGVIPSRPVTAAIFTIGFIGGNFGGDIIPERFWETIYCTSTVPITTTGFRRHRLEPDPWPLLIPALRKLKVNLHLKRLRIIEGFSSKDSDDVRQKALAYRLEHLPTLGDFQQLEAIEVGQMVAKRFPRAQVLGWLGGLSTIAGWKEHIPSLNQVTVFGIDLE